MAVIAETPQKVVISVVSKDLPLQSCPIGTHVFIKKDKYNRYDKKALSVLVKHKKTEKWTFIGYVAANPDYISENGINNTALYDLLDPVRLAANGTVVDKMEVVYPFGQVATALIVEVDLQK